jgi:hypothetical protein
MALPKRDRVLGDGTQTKFTVKTFRIDEAKAHPMNPNLGDVDEIVDSIKANGYYKPTVVVNARNGYIAAGTHTWLALRRLGWTEFQGTEIDVDEDTHLRILAVDNETAAKGKRDDDAVARLLKELEAGTGTFGTGYSQSQVERILAASDKSMRDAQAAIASMSAAKGVDRAAAGVDVTIPAVDLGGEADADADEFDSTDFDQVNPDIGVFSLKDDMIFEGNGEWDYPIWKPEMVADFDELPQNLKAWAGSATRDWPDPDQWWVYNVGVDSTSGMRDLTKAIVSFYAFDNYFEPWWQDPAKYVGRMFNSGIQYAITPDFSMHQPGVEPRMTSAWNTYRNRWLGRYFQEAGVKIIPNIGWAADDEDFLREHILGTLPQGLGSISIQLQATFSQARDKAKVESEKDQLASQIQLIFDTLKPKGALIYYGKAGRELVEERVNPGCPILWVESRVNALSERAKGRNRKKTTL